MDRGRLDWERLEWWLPRTMFLTLVLVLGLIFVAMGVGPDSLSTAARDLLLVGSVPVVLGALAVSLVVVAAWESLA